MQYKKILLNEMTKSVRLLPCGKRLIVLVDQAVVFSGVSLFETVVTQVVWAS